LTTFGTCEKLGPHDILIRIRPYIEAPPVCVSVQHAREYSTTRLRCAPDGTSLGAIDPLLGREIDGKYRIERCVASGGVGAVYMATQVNLGRPVAIKVLDTLLRPAPEARAIARLEHPNIVAIFDVGVDPHSGAYIVMEYLTGRSLGDPLGEARAIHNVGESLIFEGDYARGEELCLKAIDVGRAHGDKLLEAGCSISLGHATLCRGDADAALEWYEATLARCRELGHTMGITTALLHLGSSHKGEMHPERALPLLEECYEVAREMNNKRLLAICPLVFVETGVQYGSVERGRELGTIALETA